MIQDHAPVWAFSQAPSRMKSALPQVKPLNHLAHMLVCPPGMVNKCPAERGRTVMALGAGSSCVRNIDGYQARLFITKTCVNARLTQLSRSSDG